ncbi:MAG: hypothetical protein KGL45_02575 [Gammaproteobacteria bacterium]|nr:hypothetical protein [Gammaproteobacteria bacterium]MDE2261388.1 hypothetical protein [Gammaproteobacteria bacterium]
MFLLALQESILTPPVETLAYSDFEALLKAGKLGGRGAEQLIFGELPL